MPPAEFDIIADWFKRPGLCSAPDDPAVPLGIGDDCALLAVPEGCHLALTMDLLVEDVHFPAGADPALIAHKALAVNLSDLAAMGAQPVAFTLGLALEDAGEDWLRGFSGGLRELARRHACPLIGGDITRGRLTIAIQAHGYVKQGMALRRDGARIGDRVFVTGSLGDAGLGLRLATGRLAADGLAEADRRYLERAYFQPEPRLAFGRLLAGLASAAIDVSDGLLADLGHIAGQSGVGMKLQAGAIPLSAELARILDRDAGLALALGAGDDYELAFCLPRERLEEFEARAAGCGLRYSCIGEVVAGAGVECLDAGGRPLRINDRGYTHF